MTKMTLEEAKEVLNLAWDIGISLGDIEKLKTFLDDQEKEKQELHDKYEIVKKGFKSSEDVILKQVETIDELKSELAKWKPKFREQKPVFYIENGLIKETMLEHISIELYGREKHHFEYLTYFNNQERCFNESEIFATKEEAEKAKELK